MKWIFYFVDDNNFNTLLEKVEAIAQGLEQLSAESAAQHNDLLVSMKKHAESDKNIADALQRSKEIT